MPSKQQQYVVVLHSDKTVLGPFRSFGQALLYAESDPDRTDMEVMRLFRPARGWKKAISKIDQEIDKAAKRSPFPYDNGPRE